MPQRTCLYKATLWQFAINMYTFAINMHTVILYKEERGRERGMFTVFHY